MCGGILQRETACLVWSSPLGVLTIQLIHEMKRRGSRYGMVTMHIGGGMEAVGTLENL
jgi:hypothetical protein